MPRRAIRIAGAALGLVVLSQAAALAQETVVVPTRVIYPGQEISLDALEVVALRRELPNPDAIVLDLEGFVGKVAKNTLLPGRMVSVAALREAYAVEAGQPVEVQFVQGALVISITGVPLQPGAVGDVVRVRNLDSGTVVSGVVMGDGTVRVSS